MFYIALAVLLVLALMIGRAQLNLWGVQPVVHSNLSLNEVAPLIRSWGPWLEERGRIVVRQAETDLEIEFRKHRYSTRPDSLVFRVRNANSNRKHFEAIREAFDVVGTPYELETTPNQGRARALAVTLAAEDVHAPAAALKLVEQVFRANAGFQVYCEGRMRRQPDVPQVSLVPWRRDHAAGFAVGEKVGRVVRRLRG